MKAAILITGSLQQCQAARSAWHFASALLEGGHTINGLFLQGDAVFLATRDVNGYPALDDDARHWEQLLNEQTVPATVCSGSAAERALDDSNLRPGWCIGGLGDWVMASQESDRILHFTGHDG